MKFFLDRTTLSRLVAQLEAGLRSLNFQDNFHSFSWSGDIAPGVEQKISNGLKPYTPKGMVIESESAPLISKGDTAWDSEYVYIKNVGTSSTVTVEATFYL